MIKLKNCPFCGGRPELYENDPGMDDRKHNRVYCKACGVEGPHDPWYKLDVVIKAWNTRTPDTDEEK